MQKFQRLLLFLMAVVIVGQAKAQEVSVQLIIPDTVIAGSNFKIEVKISKGNIVSFAKLQLEIPKAFYIDSLLGDSARFLFSNTQAKYLWDRMPAKNILLVAFKATTDPAFSGARGINGSFSYIYNEEKQEVKIPIRAVQIISPAVASKTEPINEIIASNNEKLEESFEASQVEKTSEEVDDEINKILAEVEAAPVSPTAEPPVDKSELETNKENKPKIEEKKTIPVPKVAQQITQKSIPSSEQMIEFRIQIMASAVKVDILKLKSKYNLSEIIHSELHNGLWKYTVGAHLTYSAAKRKIPSYREEKGVEGAFITAYANGQRISVGEAIKQTK